MTRSITFATGCLTAVAALGLIVSASQLHAQERSGSTPMGPNMMSPGTGPHGPGMMQGTGHEAMEAGERARRGPGGWRERRDARRMARRMEILDTNNDGKVTLAEIEGELKRLVIAADVNGDGKLSAEEFRRRGRWFLRLRTVSFFDILDADGDGQVSAAEILSPTARWFKRHDEDKDKALSGDELNRSGWAHHGEARRGWRQ